MLAAAGSKMMMMRMRTRMRVTRWSERCRRSVNCIYTRRSVLSCLDYSSGGIARDLTVQSRGLG